VRETTQGGTQRFLSRPEIPDFAPTETHPQMGHTGWLEILTEKLSGLRFFSDFPLPTGFSLRILLDRPEPCPELLLDYLATYVSRGAHLLLKYSMCLYRLYKVLLWVHYRVNGLSVS